MSLPGIKYEVYCFLGRRSGGRGGQDYSLPEGTALGPDCYRFKLYDTSSGNYPAIGSPIHEIKENTAGTLKFTLFRNASVEPVFRNANEAAGTETGYIMPQIARNFMLIKQTEFVIFRSQLKGINGSEYYDTKELWSGRVTSIRKNFYGDWSIDVEGELSYLNDVTINYKRISEKGKTPPANILFREFIDDFNQKITSNEQMTYDGSLLCRIKTDSTTSIPPAIVPGSDEPINPQSVMPINRKVWLTDGNSFADAFTNDKDNIYINATSANLDDGYTVTEGSIWTNIQTLVDRYGGHLEIKKVIENGEIRRYLYWRRSGGKDSSGIFRAYLGYHHGIGGESDPVQKILFRKNLLDYAEEKNGDDLFTVLVPHGSAEKVQTKDSEGNVKVIQGAPIDISTVNSEHPGTPYIYKAEYVKKYGFIEKIENWSISNKSTLEKIAKMYYDDCRIDAVKININAYDLKNLLCTDISANDKNSHLLVDALYLYDIVKIDKEDPNDTEALKNYYNEPIPVQGIKIPLDKFPTDTEYTISNDKAKRGILQPGTLGSKEPDNNGKTDNKDGEKEEDEKIPDTKKIVDPIAQELGLDGDLAHYPPIYLSRSFDYFKGVIEIHHEREENMKVIPVDFVGGVTFRTGTWKVPEYFETNGHHYSNHYLPVKIKPHTKVFLGYSKDTVDFVNGAPIEDTTYNSFNVFYSDNIDDANQFMRRHKKNGLDESLNNWYERVYKEEHDDSDLAGYTDAALPYYTGDAAPANINPTTQPWGSYYGGGHSQAPDIKFSSEFDLTGSGSTLRTQIINKIKALSAVNGQTVGQVLSSVGVELEGDELESNFFNLDIQYRPTALGDIVHIKHQAIRYRPENYNDGYYVYRVGTMDLGDTVVVYYIYYIKKSTSASADDDIPLEIREKVARSALVRFGYDDISGKFNIDNVVLPDTSIHYYEDITDSDFGVTYAVPSTESVGIPTRIYEVLHNKAAWNNEECTANAVREGWLPEFSVTGGSGTANLMGSYASALLSYYDQTATINNPEVVEQYKRKNAYAKAYAEAVPLLVLTKDTVYGSQAPGAGSGVIGIQYTGTTLTVSKNPSEDFWRFGSMVSHISNVNSLKSMPILLTSDTIKDGTNYLFSYENDVLSITNGNPVPYSCMSASPLAIFTKCGGVHTRHIANNAFMRLAGNPESTYANAQASINKIPGIDMENNGVKNEVKMIPKTSNDPVKKWYYGTKMFREDDIKETEIKEIPLSPTLTPFIDRIDDLPRFYFKTLGRQTVVIGQHLYMRITPNLFIRISGQEEEDNDA